MKLRTTLTLAGVAACLPLLACCGSKEEPTAPTQTTSNEKQPSEEKAPASKTTDSQPVEIKPIGTATMDPDGTIHLSLRAESNQQGPPIVGDVKFTYRKGDADYQMVFDHLGGLRPGESKTVPPWPDKGR